MGSAWSWPDPGGPEPGSGAAASGMWEVTREEWGWRAAGPCWGSVALSPRQAAQSPHSGVCSKWPKLPLPRNPTTLAVLLWVPGREASGKNLESGAGSSVQHAVLKGSAPTPRSPFRAGRSPREDEGTRPQRPTPVSRPALPRPHRCHDPSHRGRGLSRARHSLDAAGDGASLQTVTLRGSQPPTRPAPGSAEVQAQSADKAQGQDAGRQWPGHHCVGRWDHKGMWSPGMCTS